MRPSYYTSLRCSFVVLVSLFLSAPGCSWLKSLKGTEDNASFPDWSQTMSGGVRGKGKEAQPSGLLFDKRSQEIEKNLGGGY